MNKKNLLIILFVLILLLGGTLFFLNRQNNYSSEEKPISEPEKETQEAQTATLDLDTQKNLELPQMEIDQSKKYTAVLDTSAGTIKIALYADKTPITVNNFVYLARQDFYNGTIFHRAIKDFMIQGGDPKGDGTGDPGYKFADEPFAGEYNQGAVAMANSGPNTNGSQFFIMHKDYPLPKNYVIFGQVVEGREVVDLIASAPTKPGPSGENSSPLNPTKISSVEIIEEEWRRLLVSLSFASSS